MLPSLCSMLPSAINGTNGIALASLSSFGLNDNESAISPAVPMDPLAVQRMLDFMACVQLGGLRLLKVCSGEPFCCVFHETKPLQKL